jgi:beta-glucanase (GH16 family)
MFLSEGEMQQAMGYLQAKWKAKSGRDERGWTRIGGLGPVPDHVRQDRPLSDQDNKGGWTLDSRLSDEFDGTELAPDRWKIYPTDPPEWKGRQPALFDRANVSVKDGMLHLVFRKGDTPELRKYRHEGYADYTSALVRTRDRSGYGYYEARCRPMNSAASSAFWLIGTGLPEHDVEIDIFEIGGNAVGHDRKYNMNTHVMRTPTEKRHWSVGGVWNAPWRLADAFHVYGFEWNADEMTWYVDGVAVRRMKNTNWHLPLNILFDSESMFSWLGIPKDEDLPSTFSIDYLRVWRGPPR